MKNIKEENITFQNKNWNIEFHEDSILNNLYYACIEYWFLNLENDLLTDFSHSKMVDIFKIEKENWNDIGEFLDTVMKIQDIQLKSLDFKKITMYKIEKEYTNGIFEALNIFNLFKKNTIKKVWNLYQITK